MARDKDALLLESVSTHRARLVSAFVYGMLAERRTVNDNVRRLIGGIVLAAVICAVCVGVSFVGSVLAQQEADRREQERQTGATSRSDPWVAHPWEQWIA